MFEVHKLNTVIHNNVFTLSRSIDSMYPNYTYINPFQTLIKGFKYNEIYYQIDYELIFN
jgi:hypothetical protein